MAPSGCLVNSLNNEICPPIVWELSAVVQPPVLQKEEKKKVVGRFENSITKLYINEKKSQSDIVQRIECQIFQRNHFYTLATIMLISLFN